MRTVERVTTVLGTISLTKKTCSRAILWEVDYSLSVWRLEHFSNKIIAICNIINLPVIKIRKINEFNILNFTKLDFYYIL